MKRVELAYMSKIKELEKLSARLERAEKALVKKQANAEKMGVANMSREEHREWLDTVPTENGWIISKADIKKNGAWYDLFDAREEVQDIKRQIENAERRMARAEQQVTAYYKKVEETEDLKKKEELFKLNFEAEQKEWKKDGISLEGRYYGETPKGKRFWIEGNNGWTTRSLHCYTLTIDGNTVFTSGEFWRAYGIIKKS